MPFDTGSREFSFLLIVLNAAGAGIVNTEELEDEV